MVGHKHTRFEEHCSDCCGEKMAQLESEIKYLEVLLEKKKRKIQTFLKEYKIPKLKTTKALKISKKVAKMWNQKFIIKRQNRAVVYNSSSKILLHKRPCDRSLYIWAKGKENIPVPVEVHSKVSHYKYVPLHGMESVSLSKLKPGPILQSNPLSNLNIGTSTSTVERADSTVESGDWPSTVESGDWPSTVENADQPSTMGIADWPNTGDLKTLIKVNSGSYDCKVCNKSFSHRSNCNKHIKSKHMNIKYRCDNCDAKLSSNQAVLKHKKKYH